jgi:hypothetical protein
MVRRTGTARRALELQGRASPKCKAAGTLSASVQVGNGHARPLPAWVPIHPRAPWPRAR